MHKQRSEEWLELELQGGLGGVSAPPELWERVRAARPVRATARPKIHRMLVWAIASMATVAVLFAVGLARVNRASDTQIAALHCQNPAQLRAWIRAKTGLDVPLRSAPAPWLQLQGAQSLGEGVEIAYRTGNRDGTLVVSRADGAADASHDHVSGNVASWVMDGQRYTLLCDNPADLQLACKLCHLD